MSLMMHQILEQPKALRRALEAEREHTESFKKFARRKGFRLTVLVACGARISGPFRHTEKSAARVLSLPLYPEVTAEDVKLVADIVRVWARTRTRWCSAPSGAAPAAAGQRRQQLLLQGTARG